MLTMGNRMQKDFWKFHKNSVPQGQNEKFSCVTLCVTLFWPCFTSTATKNYFLRLKLHSMVNQYFTYIFHCWCKSWIKTGRKLYQKWKNGKWNAWGNALKLDVKSARVDGFQKILRFTWKSQKLYFFSYSKLFPSPYTTRSRDENRKPPIKTPIFLNFFF